MTTIDKGADLSMCLLFRYHLWRIWDTALPRVVFVMLNPSTADASVDDATIRKCMAFARSWGYGGLHVLNLYAYRATNPADLKRNGYQIGGNNEHYMRAVLGNSSDSTLVVCAWGANAPSGRQDIVRGLIARTGHRAHHLGLTKDGKPKHPLYLRGDTQPVWWPYL